MRSASCMLTNTVEFSKPTTIATYQCLELSSSSSAIKSSKLLINFLRYFAIRHLSSVFAQRRKKIGPRAFLSNAASHVFDSEVWQNDTRDLDTGQLVVFTDSISSAGDPVFTVLI